MDSTARFLYIINDWLYELIPEKDRLYDILNKTVLIEPNGNLFPCLHNVKHLGERDDHFYSVNFYRWESR